MQYRPCNCDAPYDRCYRCAVDYVIRTIVGKNECSCERANGGLCLVCRRMQLPDFEEAYARAAPRSHRLAEARAQTTGLVAISIRDLGDGAKNVRLGQDTNLAARHLLEAAEKDPLGHNAAIWFVANLIKNGQPVPEIIRDWAFKAITGTMKAPQYKSKYKGATRTRDVLIVRLIEDIHRMGIMPTSGNEQGGLSGCHAVAQALCYLNLPPRTYSGVREIWRRRKGLADVTVPERV